MDWIVNVLIYNPENYLAKCGDSFILLAKCFLFFCRESALFILSVLLAHLKDPIQKRNRVPALWAVFHIAPSILLL